MKHVRSILPTVLLLSLGLVSCGTKTASNSIVPDSESTESSQGGFSFPTLSNSEPASEESTSSSTREEPTPYLLATVDHDATLDNKYVIEAEDCDTKGCTLQSLKNSFYETPGDKYPTSGGECLAAIVYPSDLTFTVDVKGTCDITFYTVCAKYENPYDLDANVHYSLDDNDPYVTGYTEFGHTDTNQWYNWKTVKVGTTTGVQPGKHQYHISVYKPDGAFPNTDCFYLTVENYVAAETQA